MKINWDQYGIDINKARGGKMLCPKCSSGRKTENRNDRCLSVDKEKGVFNCHNCGWKGSAAEDDYLERQRVKKEYSKPIAKLQKVSDKVVEWFSSRGISNNTLLQMGVTESMEWMPKANRPVKVICFNYLRDQELVNIKFRSREKEFRLESGAELIFYNLDCLKEPRQYVVITEGEIDALTFVECDIYGVLSVPNGASKGTAKLEYVDNCYELLKDIPKFCIATDGDEAGENLKQELIRRLGRERCFIPSYPTGCKDANEVLLQYGKQAVLDMVKNAQPLPIDGVLELIDVKDGAEKLWQYGYPDTLKLGWELDKYWRYRRGEVTAFTGIPNHGKSTVVDNITVELADQHDLVFAIYSPEKNPISFLIAELAQMYIGLPYHRKNPEEKMSREDWERAMRFIDDHFLFIKTDDDLTLDGFLDLGEKMVRRYGISGMIGDPWNYFEHDRLAFQSETEYIGIQLGKVSKWAKRTDVAVFLVAHPTKMEKSKKKGEEHKYLVPGLYNISGSAHWNNKVDNGLSIYRNYDNGTTEIHILKIRWFFVGKVGKVSMIFNPDSQRFSDLGPEKSPAEQSYEDKKSNQALAIRAREIVFPVSTTKDDLPF